MIKLNWHDCWNSKGKEKQSAASRVSLYISFVLELPPVCFETDQRTVKTIFDKNGLKNWLKKKTEIIYLSELFGMKWQLYLILV